MSYKIVPANIKYYDHFKAFKNNELIDWTQNTKFSIGDIVYVYSSYPFGKVSFKCEVVAVELTQKDLLHNDDDCWTTEEARYQHEEKNRFVRFKLIENLDDRNITYEYLKENGMKGRPQSQRTIPDEVAFLIENKK